MKILIVNDDGVLCKGLFELAKTFCYQHQVTVVAPDKECSGQSHRMTFHHPLKIEKYDAGLPCDWYIIHDGSPCDCAKFGAEFILKNDIDVVLSGINNGANLGSDVIYSGTVNAAVEGAMCGHKAIALSKDGFENDYSIACEFIKNNLEKLLETVKIRAVLNINFPRCTKDKIAGVKVCRAGKRKFDDEFQYVQDKGYMLTGFPSVIDATNDSDVAWALKNYITITPIRADFNDYKSLEQLKESLKCEL